MGDVCEGRAAVIPGLLAAALLLAVAAPAAAQEGPAPRGTWLTWAGCWEGTGEPVAEEAGDAMLCVRPADGVRAAELLTVVDGEVRATETLRADGGRHPVSREGCRGWESATFSEDGGRVYLRSELTCEGGVRRTGSAIMAMVSPYEWLDVQGVEIGEEASAWVQRYGLADPARAEAAGLGGIAEDRELAVESARMVAARAPGIDDVIEASERVHPEAVKAWIAEQGDPFGLDADALRAMADAGVPGEVVDVVVAVSYPERFALDGEPRERDEYRRRDDYGAHGRYRHPRSRVRVGVRFGYPYDPFYYGPYGYRSSFFYPYGFHGGFGYYRYRPGTVIVRPVDRGGRVFRGLGYSRRSRGASGGSSAAPSAGRTRDPRGGSVSPAGPSSGGRSTGRKAKPRKGGGEDPGGDRPFD